MKMKIWIFNAIMLLCSIVLPNSAIAVRACVWTPGAALGNQYIEVPSPEGIIGVNDGNYPSPTNATFANPSSSRYGSGAPQWRMTCTAPVEVTPILQTYRGPDIRFTSNWPNLQTTTAFGGGQFYYSQEMWYTGPNGNKVYFNGTTGTRNRGASFILARDATPQNPVTIDLRDLNVHQIGFQGYQVANATPGTFAWGLGGTLHFIMFEMVNYTSSDRTAYNDFTLTLYIDHINFSVRTCALVSKDLYRNIDLGQKTARDFSSPDVGGVTAPIEFSLNLRCLPNTAVTYRVNTSTPDISNDPSNSLGLIKLQGAGAASGYSIQLRALPFRQSNGMFVPVRFGIPVVSQVTAVGDANGNVSSDFIKFDVRYYRTSNGFNSRSGTADATATIDINYQ